VEPADYARLAAAVTNPLTASDTVVAQYATKYFEYDNSRRVVCEKVYGGTETSQFIFSAGSLSQNVNVWTQKTTETFTDGSYKSVYTNIDGQILLTEEAASNNSSAEHIVNHYVYDVRGKSDSAQHAGCYQRLFPLQRVQFRHDGFIECQ
jgi:hypothetical protein